MVLVTGIVSQWLVGRGISTRFARGILGAAPLVLGGCLLLLMPVAESAAARIAILVVATGVSGSIYVVCPAMLVIHAVAQRGAVIAIYGAIYTLAGILAPYTMGSVISSAATPLAGYLQGFQILAVILIAAVSWASAAGGRIRNASACCVPRWGARDGAEAPRPPALTHAVAVLRPRV